MALLIALHCIIFLNTVTSKPLHIVNPVNDISCPTQGNETCLIECYGNSTTPACKDITLNCGNVNNCTIVCNGNACYESVVINKYVNIMNLYMSNSSFNDSSIFANILNNDSVININCFYNASDPADSPNCWNITANIISNNITNIGSLNINCDSPGACTNSFIYAQMINSLSFNCSSPVCDSSTSSITCSCSNTQIYAPIFGYTKGQSSQISDNKAFHVDVYNIKGYNNIDLIGDAFGSGKVDLHCGLRYQNVCTVTDERECLEDANNTCLKGNNIYDSTQTSLQFVVPNFEDINGKLSDISQVTTCEQGKACYIYPQSLLPLRASNDDNNDDDVYIFNCAENKNCTIVWCTEMCQNMIVNAKNADHTFINCHHESNQIPGYCNNATIYGNNATSINTVWWLAPNTQNIPYSFINSTVYAENVSQVNIDGDRYDVRNITLITSLKNDVNDIAIRLNCDQCGGTKLYYLNSSDTIDDYLDVDCTDPMSSCQNMIIYYDLNEYYGCYMERSEDETSWECKAFNHSPSKEYDDSWWIYVIFIPVAFAVIIGAVYIYKYCVKKQKQETIESRGYGAISDTSK